MYAVAAFFSTHVEKARVISPSLGSTFLKLPVEKTEISQSGFIIV